jgi:hypothetical protein
MLGLTGFEGMGMFASVLPKFSDHSQLRHRTLPPSSVVGFQACSATCITRLRCLPRSPCSSWPLSSLWQLTQGTSTSSAFWLRSYVVKPSMCVQAEGRHWVGCRSLASYSHRHRRSSGLERRSSRRCAERSPQVQALTAGSSPHWSGARPELVSRSYLARILPSPSTSYRRSSPGNHRSRRVRNYRLRPVRLQPDDCV